MKDRRMYRRISADYPCTIYLPSELMGTVENVSEEGILIAGLPKYDYIIGQTFSIQAIDLMKIAEEENMEIISEVVQIVRIQNHGKIDLGCRILSAEDAWKDYVKKKELEDWLRRFHA